MHSSSSSSSSGIGSGSTPIPAPDADRPTPPRTTHPLTFSPPLLLSHPHTFPTLAPFQPDRSTAPTAAPPTWPPSWLPR